MPKMSRGGTLVEAAIILPLLFLFLMAILEFGRVLSMYQTLTDAAREGARFGVAPCQSGDTSSTTCSFNGETFQSGHVPSSSTIAAYVNQYLDAAHIKHDGNTVRVQYEYVPISAGSFNTNYRYVSVDVTAPYDWIMFPFPALPVHAQSVMKNELDIEN